MTELTTEDLDEIIKEYVRTALDVEKQVTMDWDHGPLSSEEHNNMQRGYEVALETVKDELARMDLSVGFEHAKYWLKERGIQFDRNLESHKRLALEIMIKHVKLLEIDIERHKGDYSSKVEKELLEEIDGPTPHVQRIQLPPVKPVQTSDTFKEASDDYWEEYSSNLKPRSQLDYKGYLDHIVQHFGKHAQLHTIEYMDVNSFRHTLIDNLKQTGAEEKHAKEFVGHKGRGDITWDLYGKQCKPQVLMDEVVLKLNYGLDLSHLKSSKWVTNQLTV